MRKVYFKGYKKHEYSTNIFEIRIFDFLAYWFIDVGVHFLYVNFGCRYFRFSTAGFMTEKLSKKDFKEWINKYHICSK